MRIRFFSYVRALGVTLVLLYHFFPSLVPGGFIGVDIFFTFSGYLITALALYEFQQTGKFVLRQFVERRFFRIFPTIAFAMLCVVPLTLLGSPDLRYNLTQQVFAGLGFITNIYESTTGLSYAASFAPHIFVHLWSLAIEVQFYVVWGLVLWLFTRRAKKFATLRFNAFLLSGCIFLLSSLLMFAFAIPVSDYSVLYYSPILHIFPFFLGAIFATVAGIEPTPLIKNLSKTRSKFILARNAGISGALLILLALFLQFDSKITYLLGFLAASICAVGLILWLRLLHEKTEKSENLLVAHVANVSYGVYIFHWPFLIIFKNILPNYTADVLLTLALSFALASLMFYGIDPILRGKKKLPSLPLRLSLVAAGILFLTSAVAVANTSNETTLDYSLWTGTAVQTQQHLTFAEQQVYRGESGADTVVIGDSVTMGASQTLNTALPNIYVDALGDRKITNDLPGLLASYVKAMGDHVAIVIALGTNSTNPTSDIATLKDMIAKYAPQHRLVLVTPADWGAGGPFNSDKIADWEVSIEGKYPNVYIADWRKASKGNLQYFNADGVHISDNGAGNIAGRNEWVALIKQALTENKQSK